MTQFVILDPETLSVIDWYFADSHIVPTTPGIRLEVPEGLTWDVVKGCKDSDGCVTLVHDAQKKLDEQWSRVRAQQRDLLYKSDWTCSVTDYSPPNKEKWISYRQALRDVTKQPDPFDITWPVI